ncbi:hypothetical protein K435DRAFT_943064 [Dendrothele bispora CBS 962.96]|uniref:Alpha/beta-hydrolase n=1 Tax=Dendrothele bispora (strain CBS 962.96) TaxID=1314807 RepID=A0A4V4HBH9_DENBC|nr:hypothetical protein K435DRAFT_943064 [Dendrothele bispora CBS 962.96]
MAPFPSFFLISSLASLPILVSAYDWIPDPTVAGSSDGGWQQLPQLPGADLITDFPIPGTDSVFPLYQSSGLDTSQVTRAIIVPAAEARDHWSYWITMQNIKMDLASTNSSFNPNTTSIMSPCFLSQNDISAGAGNSNQLFWKGGDWFSGDFADGPDKNDKISSFDVLDTLINHYTNASAYPNIQAVVLAGHSAAGQIFQRYAAMRVPTVNDDRVNFIVANPGSYLWLVTDRPRTNDSCTDVNVYDKYKYGLTTGIPGYSTGDFNDIGRNGTVTRYLGRNVHYALGTDDDGPGDTGCEASTQGTSHLDRGNNFLNMLNSMPNGMPPSHSIDMVEGVSHQQEQMFNSSQLRQRVSSSLFLSFFLAYRYNVQQPH